MREWTKIKSIEDETGTRRVELRQSPDGKLFRYYELQWWDACEEDEGALGDGYWSFNGMSGYFGSLTDCEKEARSAVDWLRS